MLSHPKFVTFTSFLLILTLVASTVSPPAGNLFLGLSIVSVMLSRELRSRLWYVLCSRIGLFFIALVACLLFFAAFTQADYDSAIDSLRGWRRILLFPLALAVFAGDIKLQKQSVLTIIFFFTIIALLSYLHFYFPEQLNFIRHAPGIIMIHPGSQTLAFSVGTFSLIVYYFYFKDELTPYLKISLIVAFLIMGTNVFFVSSGRSGYISFFVMCCVALLMTTNHLSFKKRASAVLILSILVCIVGISSNTVRERVMLGVDEFKVGIEQPQATSIGYRITFYTQTIQMLPKYVFLPAGTGGFPSAYAKQVHDLPPPVNTLADDPHNQYLRFLIEQGLWGFFIFMFFIYQFFHLKASAEFSRVLGISVLCAWMVSSLFNSHFSTFAEGVLIWFWLGMMFSFPKHPKL